MLGMIQEQIKPLINSFDNDRTADILDETPDIEEFQQETKVAQVKIEKLSKRAKMTESESLLLEMKRVEHELRIAQMKEEHQSASDLNHF